VRRSFLLYALDLLLSGIALIAATVFRFGGNAAQYLQVDEPVFVAAPVFVVICAVVFPLIGLYERNWRYTSIPDLIPIIKAVVLSSLIFISLMFLFTRLNSIPRSVIGLEIFILVFLLVAVRLTFRFDEFKPSFVSTFKKVKFDPVKSLPILLVGVGNGADHYLRALQRDPNSTYIPVGLLESTPSQRGVLMRGVPVLGTLDDFEAVMRDLESRNRRPRHLIFTESLSRFPKGSVEKLLAHADKCGMAISRLPIPTELRNPWSETRIELRPIELTDLLERPQAALDRGALLRLIRGRRVLITGAGGSIGSELTLQIAGLEPAELVLIENNELNLYTIDLELQEKFPGVARIGYLCNIREPGRVDAIFECHRPQLVFHAAALKHVPIVEANPCEGILTNAVGTMNIAEAAKRTSVLAMVMISSDKVVNSTSVMGMTKRLAELYCQALDIESIENQSGPRFMTVRFGNVLGSSGSLIPLFKRQLARGGPLTVTHPEMRRFFMTIREAVELTLQASAFGLERQLGQGEIFVLDMGQPIKIIDIARRMIRLAGYTPDKEIKIEIVGSRPGEKLYEELFDHAEHKVDSPIPGVLGAVPSAIPIRVLRGAFDRLRHCAEKGDVANLFHQACELMPNYAPSDAKPHLKRESQRSAAA
jgi:O-antigen biosynthesis protein WbqV